MRLAGHCARQKDTATRERSAFETGKSRAQPPCEYRRCWASAKTNCAHSQQQQRLQPAPRLPPATSAFLACRVLRAACTVSLRRARPVSASSALEAGANREEEERLRIQPQRVARQAIADANGADKSEANARPGGEGRRSSKQLRLRLAFSAAGWLACRQTRFACASLSISHYAHNTTLCSA